MSLIHFRGKAILPPLIEDKSESIGNNNCTEELEEEKLLTEPPHSALGYILHGIHDSDVNCNFSDSYGAQQKIGSTNQNEKISLDQGGKSCGQLSLQVSSAAQHSNNNEMMNTEGATENNSSRTSEASHKDSPGGSLTSDSVSDIESGICSDSINAADTQSLKSDSRRPCQVVKASKLSPYSTVYLEDYLSRLENRSCYNLYGSFEKPRSEDGTSPEENDVYLAESNPGSKVRKRTSSISSDKSVRSVGSTYMDGYLGQLMDQSWIALPTETNSMSKSYHEGQLLPASAHVADWATNPQNLEEKLQLLNADSFFDHSIGLVARNASIANELPNCNNDNNNAAVSPGLRDLSAATDINSSIFDKEDSLLEESFKSFAASDREMSVDDNSVNTVVNGPDYRLSEDENMASSIAVSENGNRGNINDDNISTRTSGITDNISVVLNNTFEIESTDRPQCDISNEVACDQSRFFQNSPSFDDGMEDSRFDAYVTADCTQTINILADNSDTLNNLAQSDVDEAFVHQKLLEFLQLKHIKELDILRRKHDEEIQQLNGNFHKLSPEQLKEMDSYITKNDSMENIFEIYTHLTEQNDNENLDAEMSVRSGPLTNSSSMPSFFLHEEKPDHLTDRSSAELTHSDRISRLFSPSRSPQSLPAAALTTLLSQHSLAQCDYQGECNSLRMREFYHRDVPGSMLSPIKEMSTSEVLEAQLSYYKHLETGLDLVPARERDLMSLTKKYELTPSVLSGICKFQAIVRGRRIRNLMVTEKVKQLLSTLMEVSNLASQFHKDILTDNIGKGDINFHKALFSQERTARQKLWHLLVELPAAEQVKLLDEDAEVKRKMSERIVSNRSADAIRATRPICRSSSMPLPQIGKSLSNNRTGTASDTRKTSRLRIPQRIAVSAGGTGNKTGLKRIASVPVNVDREIKPIRAPRSQSRSPGRDNAKRQPLLPRKNVTASNLPVSRRSIARSNSLRENNSRRNGVAADKTPATVKPKFTGPIPRPCNQKNVGLAGKPWR